MLSKIIIAIDGYSSCGKSTIAKELAKHLHYIYLDTGAMYRVVTLYCIRKSVNLNNTKEVQEVLKTITISFKYNEQLEFSEAYMNGENVERAIREMMVSERVSEISAIKQVREKMVKIQKEIGKNKGIVIDGRDIGTVVFPEAELKIFMTADQEIRVKRRFDELTNHGIKITIDEVRKNLEQRDLIDSTREESPLRQAPDAKVLDNSHLNPDEQMCIALQWAKEKIYS